MEKDACINVDLHAVKRVAEVRASAANDLLEAGWILHDIAACGARAKVEILESGHRVRFVCTDECAYTPIDLTPIPDRGAEVVE
jgi:hypothetical protein